MAENEETIELPELTDKQMEFVICIQKGMNKSDAYRAAYDCGGSKPETIWRRAAEVATSSKVAAWLEYLARQKITHQVSEATYTKERYLNDLADAAKVCRENRAWSSMVKALNELGKSAGHHTDHIEHTHTYKADIDLLDNIEKSLGKTARQEAERKLGMETRH